jgi:peptidoglycan hydrolase-like protein with peptidoglycan-binding domain
MSNPLSEMIAGGESGSAGYNAYNRGTQGNQIIGADRPIDFASLTLGQVQAMQHRGEVFAVGKYQVIPDTLDGAAASMQLDPNQKFTPELQEKIFSNYLITDKRPAVESYITGKPGATLEAAQRGLAAEWASIGDPDKGGASHYGGANHASITLKQTADALNQMRADYLADVAKGMTPSAAWDTVTATDSPPSFTHAASHHAQVSRPVLLTQGDRSAHVRELQTSLAQLGYKDGHGHPLKADGDFGLDTRHAVEKFQHDHHLVADGKAGPKTLEALHAQTQAKTAPGLDDPKNPDHALYEQALAGVRKLDAQAGRATDRHSANLAAALVVAAKKEGMTRIDDVALSTDGGTRVFAVQSDASVHKYADVPTLPSLNTPIDESSAAVQQLNQQPAPVQLQPPQAPAQAQPYPAMSR